jgi:type IV pilus assembly protein PilB
MSTSETTGGATAAGPGAPAATRTPAVVPPGASRHAGAVSAAHGAPRLLGEQLLARGLLKPDQLELALKEQRRTHEFLGKILRQLGFVDEKTLLALIAENLGVPFESIRGRTLDLALVRVFPEALLREYLFVPLERMEGRVKVAMANPSDVVVSDLVRSRLGCVVRVVAVTETEILEAIRSSFEAPILPGSEEPPASGAPEATAAGTSVVEASITEIVDHVLAYAVHQRATDVHIEPEEKLLRIRYRIDGVLHPGENLPAASTPQVTTRIKILSNLNISERRLPQDGRFRFTIGPKQIDLRVSLMPTAHGENIVLRILDKSTVSLSLAEVGLPRPMLDLFLRVAEMPHGIFFVTGPTGSGKTTTLYSMLRAVNALEKKVVTIEDPIEYQLPLVRQSQVNPGIGYSFADGLRSILRQDPDVILVGEIRDRETADVAVKASLTGHLVLTSLHTNSAAGAFPRLLDIGIDPYLVNSSVIAAAAQRLVRKTCENCHETHVPTEAQRRLFGRALEEGSFRRGRGCDRCNRTGYRGRTGVYEVLVADDEIRRIVAERGPEKDIVAAHRARGGVLLFDHALEKARAGVTTLDEVMRLSREIVAAVA